jgi:type IV secretion system protein VirB11
MSNFENSELILQSLSPLWPFLKDDNFEILINRPQEVWVDNKEGMKSYAVEALTESFNEGLLSLLASSKKKHLNAEHPILKDTWKNEATGARWRITGVIPPVSNHVNMSFRRLRAVPMKDEDLLAGHYFEKEKLGFEKTLLQEKFEIFSPVTESRYEFILNAIHEKKNIVISGSTGSSKTQFLNWCLTKIPSHERIITIEDTEELVITQPNHTQLFYPDDITQSSTQIDASRLLKTALRLKPDRIIMGEVRGIELVDMLESANTGHPGTFVTLHADSPQKAFLRMRQILMRVYPQQQAAMLDEWLFDRIDIVVQCKRQGGVFFIDDIWEKCSGKNS